MGCCCSDYRLVTSDNDKTFSVETEILTTDFGNKAYLAIIRGGAGGFQIVVDGKRCPLHKTSTFAKRSQCKYAVNAGPFTSYLNGGCIGDVIINGTHLVDDGGDFVAFGVTTKEEWFIGHIGRSSNRADELGMRDLVTGLGDWLLRDGLIIPQRGTASAPRTSIGITSEGSLVILQVDGCEHCVHQRGMTLYELAKFLVSPPIRAEHAINLDGGGSSTSVFDGKIINHPTCLDYIGIKCERPVASIVCIKEI